jgi:hypothetical protein
VSSTLCWPDHVFVRAPPNGDDLPRVRIDTDLDALIAEPVFLASAEDLARQADVTSTNDTRA